MKADLTCREAFTEALIKLAKQNKDILAVTSDARGSASLTKFFQCLPEQFVEVGIAEQNEVSIAAGLAAVGKRPYVCAPASFLSARSLEQIKIDVAYSHTNVKVFGVSGGISYGALGASHHSLHDIAAMRAIPDLKIILPSTPRQTAAMLYAIEKTDEPFYIRVGKAARTEVYNDTEVPFKIGKANVLHNGNDLTIIACGEMVYFADKAAKILERDNISARLLDMHTLKPLDEEAIIRAAEETGRIITVEEHSINGGLGAAVAQVTARYAPVPVYPIAFADEHIVTGSQDFVFEYYGMNAEGIARKAKEMLMVR